jgi:hypothetical protein
MINLKRFSWKHFALSFLLFCAISSIVSYYYVQFPFSRDVNPYLKLIKGLGFYTVLFSIYFSPFGLVSFLLAFFTKRKQLIPLYLTYALLPTTIVSMIFTYQMWKYQAGFAAG